VGLGGGRSEREGEPAHGKSELVDRLLGADKLERRQILLEALQTGRLKKSESAELVRLVERLESISGTNPRT
jgi:hypothetical protein